MRLILTNGYPFPFPRDISEAEKEAIADAASSKTFEINGVVHLEWKHTVTVQFGEDDDFDPQALTGWAWWDECSRILEAPTSAPDGYDHPAIIVGDTAYCGFMLLEE